MTHLAKDCPDKGKSGSVAANRPADGCKFFRKKMNGFSTSILLVLISSAAFFLICLASMFQLLTSLKMVDITSPVLLLFGGS